MLNLVTDYVISSMLYGLKPNIYVINQRPNTGQRPAILEIIYISTKE